MNLLLEKRGYLMKIWFIWFKPWFTRPGELYIHAASVKTFFSGILDFMQKNDMKSDHYVEICRENILLKSISY